MGTLPIQDAGKWDESHLKKHNINWTMGTHQNKPTEGNIVNNGNNGHTPKLRYAPN